jgi:hypothetical protein
MSYGEVYIAERTMGRRVEENLQQMAAHHLRRRMKAERANRWRWFVCNLGYRLVALGAWLEQYSLPQSPAGEAKLG